MMKKLWILMIPFILVSGHAIAYCDFEAISMESPISSLSSKADDTDLQNSSGLFEVKVSSNKICNDPNFKDINLIFKFFDNKLHQIRFVSRVPSEGHLRNLQYFYGEPLNVDDKYNNQKYYHWDEPFKNIFLIIEKPTDNAEALAYVEISSNKYKTLAQEYYSDGY